MKTINILFIVLRLFLGGFMIYGGIQKFQKPIPAPIEVVEKAEKFKAPEKEGTLQKILYISGAKQTGYFWQVLGICELLFGLLLLLQGTSFVGAIFLLPITLHIFLFHVFLESDEISELLQTGALFAINIALVLKERAKWKHLLWIKPI
ncbi:DoxX family membrane protein [Flagellimonas sp. HMM57]|uniref:DoxX family membrane protein n=1 Tax=unclassified Flagellimonas TaxID=2644544 RepID=UPI0013D1ED18|nr:MULTISPECIES: DoxX family membrane protein [unclassified Flagellimonas]UII74824.1 DoxX family membrane protein [Flagellimonas sp. HMM57]